MSLRDRIDELAAPDVTVYLYRLLREERGSERYGVELALLDELATDLENGAELGETEDIRQAAADAIAATQRLRDALVRLNAAG